MTRESFLEKYQLIFADNEFQNITEATFRQFKDDIASTFLTEVPALAAETTGRLFTFTGTSAQPQAVLQNNFYLVNGRLVARAKASFNASATPANNAYWEVVLQVPAPVAVLQSTGTSTTATISQAVLSAQLAAVAYTPITENQYGSHPALGTASAFRAYVLQKLSALVPAQIPAQPAQGQVDDFGNTFSALLVPGWPTLVQYEGFGFPGVTGIVPLTSEIAYLQNGRLYLKGLTGPIGIGEVGFRVAASGSQPAGPFVLNKEPFTGPVVSAAFPYTFDFALD